MTKTMFASLRSASTSCHSRSLSGEPKLYAATRKSSLCARLSSRSAFRNGDKRLDPTYRTVIFIGQDLHDFQDKTRFTLHLPVDPQDCGRCHAAFPTHSRQHPSIHVHSPPTTAAPANAPSADSNRANARALSHQTKTCSRLPSRSNHQLHPPSRSTRKYSTRDSRSPRHL